MKSYLIPLETGHFVVARRIKSIVPVNPGSPLVARKLRNEALQEGLLINTAQGKATQTILVLDSGHVLFTGRRRESVEKEMRSGQGASAAVRIQGAAEHPPFQPSSQNRKGRP